MARVTQDNIIEFNKLYAECHNYSEVARRTGFSASTVRKYVSKNTAAPLVMQESKAIKIFTKDMIPPFSTSLFTGLNNFGSLCELTDTEKEEMKELWEELPI